MLGLAARTTLTPTLSRGEREILAGSVHMRFPWCGARAIACARITHSGCGRGWEQLAECSVWRREPPSPQPSPGGEGDTGRPFVMSRLLLDGPPSPRPPSRQRAREIKIALRARSGRP